MEVILMKDVDCLGIKNEVVKVKDGYARNYLLKQNFAIVASTGNRKNLTRQIEKATALREKRLSEARLLAVRLGEITLSATRKAGREGKLYGSITSQQVAELLETAAGRPIDRRKLIMPHHIKVVGVYSVQLRLEPGVNAELKLEVNGEVEGADGLILSAQPVIEKIKEPKAVKEEESTEETVEESTEESTEEVAE
jgi:large subunit ribosomal protein L9